MGIWISLLSAGIVGYAIAPQLEGAGRVLAHVSAVLILVLGPLARPLWLAVFGSKVGIVSQENIFEEGRNGASEDRRIENTVR